MPDEATATVTPFEPMLSLTVPPPAQGTTSLYAGRVFRVEFVKTAGPVSGCSSDDGFEFVVGTDGAVAPRSGALSLIGTVGDDPLACEYELRFPKRVSSVPGAASPWVLQLGGAAAATLSAAAATHSRTFRALDAFAPAVSIGVPQIDVTIDGASSNLFSDVLTSEPGEAAAYGPVTFSVDFFRSGGPVSGCSSEETATYTVQTDGTVTGHAPALVDRLMAGGSRCVYAVTFQSAGLLGGLMKATDPSDDNSIMGGETATAATYTNAVFDGGVLSVDITTPPYTGTARTVDVTLMRAAGASIDCGARPSGVGGFVSPTTVTVTLAEGGSTSVDPAFDYVDFPAGAASADDRCAYTVSWSDTDEIAQGASLWQRHSGTSEFAGAGRVEPTNALMATYAVGPPAQVPFTATLQLVAAPGVSGNTTFDVRVVPVSGSHRDCSTPPATPIGAPAPDPSGVTDRARSHEIDLVDRPAGEVTHCAYTVTWPRNERNAGATPTYELDQTYPEQNTALSAATGSSRVASARYVPVPPAPMNVGQVVTVDLTSAVPVAARNSTIEVSYRHATASPAACKAMALDAIDRWRIGDDGTLSRTGVADLPAMPRGGAELCRYEVVWPDVAGLTKPVGTTVVWAEDGRRAVRGEYALDTSGAGWIHDVRINLPFRDANLDSVNDYNPVFSVGVTKRGAYGPAQDCPESVTIRPKLKPTQGQQQIRDARLAGMHMNCKLRTNFPDTIPSGVPGITLVLNRGGSLYGNGSSSPAFYDRFTDGADNDAIASYSDGSSTFRPDITVTLPTLAPNSARNRTYQVNFEPRLSSLRGVCQAHPDEDHEDWNIAADGTIRRVSTARLLWRSATVNGQQGADCGPYTVVWPDIPGLARPSGTATVALSADLSASRATGTYVALPAQAPQAAVQTNAPWTLRVEIEMPFRDTDADGVNDYNPAIRAVVTRVSNAGGVGLCLWSHELTARIDRSDGASQLAAVASLSNIASGCVLNLQFENTAGSGSTTDSINFTRTSDPEVMVSKTNSIARATYVDGRTTFQPNISLDGFTSAQAGEEVEVEFRVQTGSRPECRLHLDRDHESWRVGSDGTARRQSRVDLINVPAGQTSHCSYNVIWPDVPGTIKPSGAAPTVRQTSRAATGTYSVPIGLPFSPHLTLDVPWTDDDANDAHDYAGVEFAVTFSPQSGHEDMGCSPANTEFRYEIRPDAADRGSAGGLGAVVRLTSSSATTLVRLPVGTTHHCEYVVTWPDTEDGGTTYRRSGPRTMVIDASVFDQQVQTLTNRYAQGTVMLVPEVSVVLPSIDLDSDGVHDMSSERLFWRFTRNRSPVEDANCTQELTGVYKIDDDGEVSLSGTRQNDGSVSPGLALVGWHEDSERECRYTVNFQPNADFEEDDAWNMRDTQISWSDPSARARFDTSRVGLSATFGLLSYGVPDGVSFLVRYELDAGEHAGCRQGVSLDANNGLSLTLTVGLGPDTGSVRFTDWPKGWRTAADRCVWTAVWPTHEVDGTTYVEIERPAGAQEPVTDRRDATSGSKLIVYRNYYASQRTTFTPSVRVSVPFDDDGNGENRFAGETVTVTYRRVAGQQHESDCTALVTDTFTITAGVSASAGGVLTRGALPELTNNPQASNHACQYTASASSTTRAAGGGVGQLNRVGEGSARIDHNGVVGTGATPSFAYESVFVANVDISLPGDARDRLGEAGFENGDSAFKGGRFEVTFTRTDQSPAECLREPRTVVFTVDKDGTPRAGDSAAEAALLTFVDQVGGNLTPCAYTVEFPLTISSGGTTSAISWLLRDQDTANDPVTVSRANPSVTRRYRLVGAIEELLFVSPVRIAVPADVDSNNVNRYAGATISVYYAVASGGAHCVLDRTRVQYPIPQSLDDGISPTGGHPVLVSQRPAAQRAPGEAPCAYTAILPTTITSNAGVSPAWTLNLNGNNVFRFDIDTEDTTFNYLAPGSQTGGNTGNTQTGGASPGTTTTTSTSTTTTTEPQASTTTTTTTTSPPDTTTTTTVPAAAFTQVSAGGEHSCGRMNDGTVVCWGNSDDGRTAVPAGRFTQVSAGSDHSCGVRVDGSVACWGDDSSGPATPPTGSFAQVSAGGSHSCGVKVDGSVACWGNDGQGRATAPDGSFTQVSAGAFHSCGVKVDGSVACWGFNGNGQLTPPSGSFAQVSAGSSHTCGVRSGGASDGTVECWGNNGGGRATPPPGAGASFAQVSAGGSHSCGVKADGTIACWGNTSSGQASPPAVRVGVSFVAVSAGGSHSCGVKADGTIACWGADNHGQSTPPTVPVNDEPSLFTPSISVSVPRLEGTTPGENVWAGEELDVALQRASGAHSDCSLSASAVVTYTVGVSGVLTTDDADLPTQLIGTLSNPATTCEYVIRFLDPPTDEDDPDFSWTMTAPPSVTLSGTNTSVSGHYTVGVIRFEPSAAITVPDYLGDDDPDTVADESTQNPFTGERFTVPFTSNANGCVDEMLTYEVQADDTIEPDPTNPTLVAYPVGTTTPCTYTVAFGTNEDGTGTRLALEPNSSVLVTGVSQAITASYLGTRTTFEPDVTVEVPYVDGDANNMNDIAGETVVVTYTRVAGSHEDCTRTSQETYVVGGGRSVAGGGETELVGSAASLVDRPARQDLRCAYVADFADRIPETSGGQGPFVIETDNVELTKTQRVTAIYSGDTVFGVDLALVVPDYDRDGVTATNYYEGVEFEVTFVVKAADSPAFGCSANTTVTYEVQANDEVVPTSLVRGGLTSAIAPGALPTFIDIVGGVAGNCVYVATFPGAVSSTPGATPVWTLRRAPSEAATAEVSEMARKATRAYIADAINFAPSVVITVPPTLGLANGGAAAGNLFAGTDFTVGFRRATGAHEDCSAATRLAVTYTVGVNGVVSGTPPASLVDRPAGQLARCVYDMTFDAAESSVAGAELTWTLNLDAGATTSINGGAPAATASYTATEVTYFPDATISVPPYLGDDDPDTTLDESTQNAFAGERFTVQFASSAAGCDDATLRYTVGPTGVVTADATTSTLVAYPASRTTLCTYEVGFEANEDGGTRLARGANASTSVTGTAQTIVAEYLGTQTTFEPDVNLSVPYVDADGNSENDIANQAVTVTYAPAVTQPQQNANCTDTATETYRVDNSGTFAGGGSVTRTTAAASLVDRPAGVNNRCRYTAAFTPSISGNGQGPFDIAANNFPLTNTVTINPTWAGDTRFTPGLMIGVPQIEGLAAGENMFAQATFSVTIARAPGAHSECSAETDIAVTYTVAANGLVLGTPPALVDRPEGQRAPCVYNLTFPPQVTPLANAQLGWTLTRGVATASVSGGAQAATASYTVGVVTFTPNIAIEVPDYNGDDDPETAVDESTQNAFTGRTFGLVMARSSGPDTGCDAAAETYVVGADGTVAPRDGSAPILVHVPLGNTSEPCFYDVIYPTHSGTSPELNRDETSLDTTTRASDPATTATYRASESTFTPSIDIDVPSAVDAAMGKNLFTDTTFQVRFSRTTGSHDGCSAEPALTVIYSVDADGTVTGTPPLLVDRPAKQVTRCAYEVATPTSRSSEDASTLRWTLTRAASATTNVNGGAATVTASYTSGPVTFVPAVAIDVPSYNADDDPNTLAVDESTRNAFTGRTFGVRFGRADGPLSGCETVTETYSVDANGHVAPVDGTAPLLVHYPSGESASACVYDVTFPPVVGAGLPLNRQAETLDATTRAEDAKAAATYRASQSTFAPSIKIDVPVIARASDDSSLFADTTFAVTFQRTTSSHRDCSAETAVTVTYAVDAKGDVVGTPPASLVDRPAGQERRCEYAVTTPTSRQSGAGATRGWTLIRAAGTTTSVNGGASAVNAAYAVGDITFAPTVTITVPAVDDGQGGNLFAGATFVVSFRQSGGPDDDCSPDRTLGFTMRESRTLTVSAPELIDVPAGRRDSCVYSVEFPSTVNSVAGVTPAWMLTDSGVGVAELSAASPTATRAYVGGSPVAVPTTRQPTARTAGTSGSGRSVGRSSGGSARGGSARSVSVPDAPDADDEPDADVIEPVVVAADDEFAGFVPSLTERVPVSVSLTMPLASVSVDAIVEVLISAPGVCGSDMATFGGLPAQVGLVYALNARSGLTSEVVQEGAQLLSAFADRGDERRPCALRVTVLVAPDGCAFADAPSVETGFDDAGRSYVELTWSDDTAAFRLAPTLACERS